MKTTITPQADAVKPMAAELQNEWEGFGIAFQTLIEHCGEAHPHFESPRGQADIVAAVSEYAKLTRDRAALLERVEYALGIARVERRQLLEDGHQPEGMTVKGIEIEIESYRAAIEETK